MASKVIVRMQDTAEKLYAIRKEISRLEEENKKALESLKLERDALQAALLADLKENNLSSIKVSNGDSVYKGVRTGVEIISEPLAFKWALENRAVSIDRVQVIQKLKDAKEIPPGFDLIQSEFISVRKAKKHGEEI